MFLVSEMHESVTELAAATALLRMRADLNSSRGPHYLSHHSMSSAIAYMAMHGVQSFCSLMTSHEGCAFPLLPEHTSCGMVLVSKP